MATERREIGPVTPSYTLFSREQIDAVFEKASEKPGQKPFDILKASLLPSDKELIRTSIEVLSSDWLNRFAAIESVTFTMIRPFTKGDTRTGITAKEFGQRVMETATFHGFSLVFETSLAVPEDFWGEFYRDQKEKLLLIPPAVDFDAATAKGNVNSRWEQMVKTHTDGPVQFIILLDRQQPPIGHSAVNHWRSLMGNHYDPKRSLEGSLRAIHAKNYYNNLIHGSDSSNSAMREIHLLTQLLNLLAS